MHFNLRLKWMDLKERCMRKNLFGGFSGKRCVAVVLFALMMLSGAAVGLHAYASLPKYGLVTASGLMLREKPSTKSDSIDVIPNGGVVRIFRQSTSDNDWYQVYYNDAEGYVMSKYLRFDVSSDEVEASKSKSSKSSSKSSSKVEIPSASLRKGDKSSYVKAMQKQLKEEGFEISADGVYGENTESAVLDFQEDHDLKADGVAGIKTLTELYDGNVTIVKTEKSSSSKSSRSSDGDDDDDSSSSSRIRNVSMPDWWSEASKKFGRGDTATVTDVKTGLSYKVKRYGGTNHADCEPLTKEDAKIMKKIYGGSWSWSRRAIIVQVDGKSYAASQNGMPHGSSSISSNGFSGHFCIHFKNSRTHGSNKVDKDHQSAVKSAYNAYN